MKKLTFLGILLFLFATRLFLATILPPGLSDDEVEYAISAKSYSLYGKDVSGYRLPVSLFKTETYGKISPVPAIFTSLPLKIFPLNLTTLRISYTTVNLITAILLYIFVITIFKTRTVAILATILFILNPWSTFLSYYIGDSPFALLFYLAAVITLIKYSGKKMIIPFILFALAFFSYQGGKLIFIPVILITIWYKTKQQGKDLLESKSNLLFIALSIIFLILYLFISYKIPNSDINSRINEISSLSSDSTSIVNKDRRQTISIPLNNFFINKFVIETRTIIKRYLSAFSPEILFISGDTRALYRFEENGLFYLIDIPLIILGILEIYKRKKNAFHFLIALLIIAPLPTALSKVETSVIHRSFFLLPILTMFSAYGLYKLLKFKKLKSLLAPSLIVLLLIQVLYFYHFYFFRLPVLGQEKYWLSESVLKKYLNYSDLKAVFVSPAARSSFLRFILLSDNKTQKEFLKKDYPYRENETEREYQFKNITFTHNCPEKLDDKIIYAISYRNNCKIDEKPSFLIQDQRDAGTLISIYNSKICQGISKDTYRRFHLRRYYSLEKMNYEDFCSNWINIPLPN